MRISILALIFLLGGCAQVNSVLSSANSVLGTANDALGTVNGKVSSVTGYASGDKVYNVGNKSTAAYDLIGFKVVVANIDPKGGIATGFSGRADVIFTGKLKNKTNRRIGVSFSVPIYDKSGNYLRSATKTAYAPAHETAVIDLQEMGVIEWNGGERPNVQKMKFGLQKF